MGISRDSRHKRRLTGGRYPVHKKKRKYELGRPSANTKLGTRLVRKVRCRGGNLKFRALRLDSGNFSWGTQGVTRKTRIIDVVYNASSNELVRTKTIVKNCIIIIDATPFKLWFRNHYGHDLGKTDDNPETPTHFAASIVPKPLLEQFSSGRLLACVSSRPGQCGRCDGYILEGDELTFYKKRMDKKRDHNLSIIFIYIHLFKYYITNLRLSELKHIYKFYISTKSNMIEHSVSSPINSYTHI